VRLFLFRFLLILFCSDCLPTHGDYDSEEAEDCSGWVTEWLIVHAWKACVPKGTGGSNPPPSALLRACASQDRVLVCAKLDALRSLSEGGLHLDYVYLIESLSAGRQRYVGMTDDLRQRLREHNAAESSYTAKFRTMEADYLCCVR
jgi:hypothetical protein